MNIRTGLIALALCTAITTPALAQQDPQPPETISVFGWDVPQDERFKISGAFIAAWSHDGLQAQLGLEKQGRIAQAILAVSGRLSDRVRYFVSINPANEVS